MRNLAKSWLGLPPSFPDGSDTSQYEGARRRGELLHEIVPANTRSAHESEEQSARYQFTKFVSPCSSRMAGS